MSVANFKLLAETLISDHLDKIESGEVRTNVANQHDMYVCESALEVLASDEHDEEIERAVRIFQHADMENVGAVSLAHTLSKFEPEALDSAWTD